jgi:hypothetical protein
VYQYADTVPADGFWYYWLAAVSTSGSESVIAGPVREGVDITRIYLPLILK